MDLQKKSHQNYDYDDYSDRDDAPTATIIRADMKTALTATNAAAAIILPATTAATMMAATMATAMTTVATMAGDYRPAGSRLASLESAGLFFLAVSPWRFCGTEGNSKCRQW